MDVIIRRYIRIAVLKEGYPLTEENVMESNVNIKQNNTQ